ncbi:hypothetical protein [Streptomyces sp. NPDC056361]|uniref:hypothetical protein n=1 Tax=Streptomyces sp. NPDC056361 TaxID=3345795 RepID=UPI0035D762D4
MRSVNRFSVVAGTIGAAVLFALPGNAFAVTKMSQSSAASALRGVGITWSSSGGCTNRNNSTCTSFEQINTATVNDLKTLRTASGCGINVTGGTETGHASGTYSHWNGYKADITHNSCIDSYVKNSFTRISTRSDGSPRWRSAAGNVYADEGNHWDITYCGGSSACTSSASA